MELYAAEGWVVMVFVHVSFHLDQVSSSFPTKHQQTIYWSSTMLHSRYNTAVEDTLCILLPHLHSSVSPNQMGPPLINHSRGLSSKHQLSIFSYLVHNSWLGRGAIFCSYPSKQSSCSLTAGAFRSCSSLLRREDAKTHKNTLWPT